MRNVFETPSVIARGVAAGILGTALMTLIFVLFERTILREATIAPSHPEGLVMRFARKTGFFGMARPEARGEAATIAHFGYGALWGIVYALARLMLPIPTLAGGAIVGLVVWAIGFVGWLPAIRHLPAPWRQSPAQLMAGLASHLAYGLGTVAAYFVLSLPSTRMGEYGPAFTPSQGSPTTAAARPDIAPAARSSRTTSLLHL